VYFRIALPPYVAPEPGDLFLLSFGRLNHGIDFRDRRAQGRSGQKGEVDAPARNRFLTDALPDVPYPVSLEIRDKSFHEALGLFDVRIGEHRHKLIGMAAGGKPPNRSEIPVDADPHPADRLLCGIVAQRPDDRVELFQCEHHHRVGFSRHTTPQLCMVEQLELPPGVEAGQLLLQPLDAADHLVLERMVEFLEFFRSALENDLPFVKGQNAIRYEIDIRNLVADQDRRETEFPLVLGDHAEDCVLPDGILAGGRFIEQDDARIGHQRPRQGDTLLHPPRKLRRVLPGRIGQFRLLHPGHRPAVDLGAGKVGRFQQGEGDILLYGQGVEQGVALKHVADLGKSGILLVPGHIGEGFSPEKDHPRVRFEQADDMFEQDALSRPAQADDRRDLALIDLQVHPLQHGPGTEALRHPFEFDQRCIHEVPHLDQQ
jgi:hypothetical protein